MYWLSLIQIVGGLLIYQAAQKVVPKSSNPFWFIALSYGIGMTLCLVLALTLPGSAPDDGSVGVSTMPALHLDPRMLLCALGLGLGATLIEIGYFWGYRSGWAISELPVVVMIVASVCLTVIGVLWFREELSLLRTLGLALCGVGLFLVLRK